MEDRILLGDHIGGAYSGRRLLKALAPRFRTISRGDSDWRMSAGDRYTASVQEVMQGMLSIIYHEMLVQQEQGWSALDRAQLDAWYDDRKSHLDAGALTMRVHQVDVLARKR